MNLQVQTRSQIHATPHPPLRDRPFLCSAQRRPCRRLAATANGGAKFGLRVCGSSSSRGEELSKVEEQKKRRAYPFHEIEPRWQRYWEENRTFRTPDDDIDTSKPKFYVLDMFPYPRFCLCVCVCVKLFVDLGLYTL